MHSSSSVWNTFRLEGKTLELEALIRNSKINCRQVEVKCFFGTIALRGRHLRAAVGLIGASKIFPRNQRSVGGADKCSTRYVFIGNRRAEPDRCELICRFSFPPPPRPAPQRDRSKSLAPFRLRVIPGLRISNFG